MRGRESGGEVGRDLGRVEGAETIIRIHCMRKQSLLFNKRKTWKNPSCIYSIWSLSIHVLTDPQSNSTTWLLPIGLQSTRLQAPLWYVHLGMYIRNVSGVIQLTHTVDSVFTLKQNKKQKTSTKSSTVMETVYIPISKVQGILFPSSPCQHQLPYSRPLGLE